MSNFSIDTLSPSSTAHNTRGKILFLALLLVLLSSSTAVAKSRQQVEIKGGNYLPAYQVSNSIQEVYVAPFLLDIHPVTDAEYLTFLKANPKWRRSNIKSIFADEYYLQHWAGDLDPGYPEGDRPVVYISWFAARAYADWAGKRLPTLDEWEFVARADEKRLNATKDQQFLRRILDWYGKPTPNPLPAIGTTYQNIHGVHDLHGLVWEWVDDFNSIFVTGESRRDSGLDRGLFCAAGSVGSTAPSDYAAYMRYAYRSSLSARYSVGNLGFRCAKDIP